MSNRHASRIDCSVEAREQVKAQKRGGESYDEVLRKMVEQYNPGGGKDTDAEAASGRGTKIPCSQETRELVKAQKRGGETYDELLPKMVEQYDPARGHQTLGTHHDERGNA